LIEDWIVFCRKMKKYARKKRQNFRYVALVEKHTGKRAGDTTIKTDTYHIHFCSDRVWPKRLLQSKWRHGFCNFADWRIGTRKNDLDAEYGAPPCDNPGAYMSKYLGKDFDSEGEAFGKKRYWCSQHLRKPLKLSQAEAFFFAEASEEIWRHDYQIVVDDYLPPLTVQQITYRVPKEFALNTHDNNLPEDRRRKRARLRLAQQSALAAAVKSHDEHTHTENDIERIFRRIDRRESALKEAHYRAGFPHGRASEEAPKTSIHLQRACEDYQITMELSLREKLADTKRL
jgi:hypothetical protein